MTSQNIETVQVDGFVLTLKSDWRTNIHSISEVAKLAAKQAEFQVLRALMPSYKPPKFDDLQDMMDDFNDALGDDGA